MRRGCARARGVVQLAADAKTVNPRLKVSILRWVMPQWVQTEWNKGTGTDEMYKWYKETILDAYEKYGYMVDYVDPDTNETANPDISFVKWYKTAVSNDTEFADSRYGLTPDQQRAAAKAYHNIKIIAQNGTVTLKGPVHSDQEKQAVVAKATEIAGAGNVKDEISVTGDADRSK